MRIRAIDWVLTATVTLLSVGCGGDDSGGAAGTTTGAAGIGGVGGAGVGGTGGSSGSGVSWPAPTNACGTLGQECANPTLCTGDTICMVGMDVCLPRTGGSSFACTPGSCPSATPYCVGRQCMTAEQAACVCSTDHGKTAVPVCSLGPADALGTCLASGALCDSNPAGCCGSLVCVQGSDFAGQCMQRCTDHGDCSTGCCADAGTERVCAPSSICGFGPSCEDTVGAACGGGGDPCCNPLACVTSTNPDFQGCRPRCNGPADCESGCCQPFSGSTGGFCVDARFCVCAGAGEACGSAAPGIQCCEDSVCMIPAGGTAICAPRCVESSDCATQCCVTLQNSTDRVCFDNGGNPC